MMPPYATFISVDLKLITSREDNMRRVSDILALKRGLLGICTRLGVWPRGIKNRKLRRWLGLKLYVLKPAGLPPLIYELSKALTFRRPKQLMLKILEPPAHREKPYSIPKTTRLAHRQ